MVPRPRSFGWPALLLAAALSLTSEPKASDFDAAPLRAAILWDAEAGGRSAPLAAFYRSRSGAPVFVETRATSERRLKPAAERFFQDLRIAARLDPALAGPTSSVEAALASARSPTPEELALAEVRLTGALLEYAERRSPPPPAGFTYVDAALQPRPRPAAAVLAAAGEDLEGLLASLRQANPVYDRLREAYATAPDGERKRLYLLNLARARALPADLGPRYILVNIPAQRLDMVEQGVVVGSMRVVVGKPSDPTPPLAALIRYAVVRPYWNIPPDIARHAVAPKVLHDGVGLLAERGYEALSDWTDRAEVIDPLRIDWRAAAAGTIDVRLRQRPGPDNMMGRIKFMFPNDFGVYLHDTPIRGLFAEETRTASHGCVRLEDAAALARWLLGARAGAMFEPGPPEAQVPLPEPVPVYIVYLTAAPGRDGVISTYPDVYGEDGLGSGRGRRPVQGGTRLAFRGSATAAPLTP